MSKKEVLVDTVFLEKLTKGGKNIEIFIKILNDLEFIPVVHPYLANNELDMFPYFTKLVDDGHIKVAAYGDFLRDEEDKELYEKYFTDIHREMRKYLEAAGGKKQLNELAIPNGQTVFTYRKASMSLGDVHMILMAFFMKMPVILTEDSDIDLLRSITNRKMSSDSYKLQIYNAVDLLKKIAQKEVSSFSKQEIVEVVKKIGERTHLAEIKQIWNKFHNELQ